jgi:phosphate-selective porin OprO and OprP
MTSTSIRRALAALVLILATAAGAAAQGSFYREVEKDGRIYVFNNMTQFADWEKSGEMGIGITLLGYGPGGETMVFDSEEAIHLYNYKHNRPGDPRPQPTPAPRPTVSWRDGATTLLFPGVAQVKISNRVQVRYSHEMPDDTLTLPGTGGPGDSRGSFRIRRAKFKVDGWFYRSWLLYELQTNWAAIAGGAVNTLLEDANINWDITKGERKFMVKFGQYKVPFGLQELTSSGSQQFVDRSQVSNTYARGRDTGIQLWGRLLGDKIEWRAGAFNGNGLTRTINDNDKFQYNARLMWQPNGSQVLNQRAWVTGALYSESDFESTTAPIYAVAINWDSQNNFNATTGNDQKWQAFSLDGIYKYKGFSVNGMYAFANRKPETGDEFNADGYFIQAGKLFSRRRYEVALRYGESDPSDLASRNTTKEARGVFSYYYARHGLKWQTDFGQVEVQSGTNPTVKTFEIRSQLQFVF